MSQYNQMVMRQRKGMLYLLAILVIGSGFSPFPAIFLGLLLGSLVSFFNLWLLQRKIQRFVENAAEGESVFGLGTLSRLAAAGLAVLIAMRFDFHILAVVAGLGSSYAVIVISFLLPGLNTQKKQSE
ncbi:hypothetical protein GCM10028778_23060 [Barrientosiimonas marina]|uniref:ATP synthase subunit I n=1 Tax=Lentibacillus kimchii TaxID=1542911 RepID=A0ABW2UXW1_9BACI